MDCGERHEASTLAPVLHLRLLSGLVATALVLTALGAAPAAAQDDLSVLVLGIRSVDGDDEFTTALTGVIRHHARSVPGWSVHEVDLSLDQAMLIQGCDAPTTACMASIAAQVSADKIIYGTVRRTTADAEADFALSLELFDTASGRVEHSLTDVVARGRSDVDDLRPRARRYVLELAGQERFGVIYVRANVPGAEIRVDGHAAGATDENGEQRVSDVREGLRTVQLDAEGYEPFETSARVVANEEIELRANLIVNEPRNLRWVAGTSALGVGAAFAVMGIVGSTRAAEFQSAREEVINGTTRSYSGDVEKFVASLEAARGAGPDDDICEGDFGIEPGSAQARERDDACAAITQAHNLQMAGYTLAGAMGITGVVLLWWAFSDGGDDVDAQAILQRVQVYPQMSDTEAGVGVRVAF